MANRAGSGESGFTLVELMVALLVGLLVVLGASQLFISSKQSFDRMGVLALRQESLRFVVDIVSLDIRSSGIEHIDDSKDKELELGYTTRTSDPYCNDSGDDLIMVRYSYSGGEIRVKYDCGDGWVGPQSLVSGLDDADFVYHEGQGFVDVFLKFSEIPGESLEARSFTFRVANREGVTR
jgi:type IV pilus assembly protein PilW